MAKRTIVDIASLEDADAWQEQESRPLYYELAKIEERQSKFMAEIVDRKRAIRDHLLEIEQQAAEKRVEYRDPNAGPDAIIGA